MYRPSNHIMVIFGASGDLTRRKLIPALGELQKLGLLPLSFAVLGVGRSKFNDKSFREMMSNHLDEAEGMIPLLHYHSMDSESEEDFTGLAKRLEQMSAERNMEPSYLFYLATPPSLYETIPRQLSLAGLTREKKGQFRRIIVEKPFGMDYESAVRLNRKLLSHLKEHQIYRIDHYLGKETVQNVLVSRFSNGIFEPLWNRNYIHHVEITSAESLGVGTRGGYYDQSGALRDMLQNHLLQLVGLVAMEPPTIISPDAIRNEVLKVFQSFRPLTADAMAEQVIRGQYLASHVRGEAMKGYRSEEEVPEESRTESFVAMKLYIDNWRWGGVPFYIRTGKRLPTKVTEIVVHFKPSPHRLFADHEGVTADGNQLVIRIQPDEGILLKFGMKVQGAGFKVQDANLDFHYKNLSDSRIPEAYQRLLLDCMQGDSTLYTRGDAVEAAWRFLDPVLAAWKDDKSIPLYGYPCGTWGPEEADGMFKEEGYTWRYPCKNLAEDGQYCQL
ncbi:MAG: glucose-6-phosphate dehydrogenase [Bacteroidales bacterium]|nr:glucose-6-phosphate dehydrogenase [Bacteroidales bacterium]